MTTIEMQMTHDEYVTEMHPEYTRIISGRKHVIVYDHDYRPHLVPVKIVSKKEVDEQ